MKKLSVLILLLALAGGCVSSKFMRLVPENKDLDALIVYPYGQIVIRSRVNPQGTNTLPALNNNSSVISVP